jgi:sugar O-acyltransferase (sialic acid O-acetyltransferase NeuD family)
LKSVVLFGAGGFGREVMEILKTRNKISEQWDILGFIDENPEIHGTVINGFPVIGGPEWLIKNNSDELLCSVTIGDCKARQKVVAELNSIGTNFCNIIHPSVIMSDSVKIGQGVIICAGTILTVNIEIGDHVQINPNSTIFHDVVIGDYCTLTSTVKLTGNTSLGKGVYMGTGASVIPGHSVGSWSIIGAGAIVIKDIPEGVTAAGIPAKVLRKLPDTEFVS